MAPYQLTSDQGNDEGSAPGVEGVPLEALLTPAQLQQGAAAGTHGGAALTHAHLAEGQPHVEAARNSLTDYSSHCEFNHLNACRSDSICSFPNAPSLISNIPYYLIEVLE